MSQIDVCLFLELDTFETVSGFHGPEPLLCPVGHRHAPDALDQFFAGKISLLDLDRRRIESRRRKARQQVLVLDLGAEPCTVLESRGKFAHSLEEPRAGVVQPITLEVGIGLDASLVEVASESKESGSGIARASPTHAVVFAFLRCGHQLPGEDVNVVKIAQGILQRLECLDDRVAFADELRDRLNDVAEILGADARAMRLPDIGEVVDGGKLTSQLLALRPQ